MSNTERKLDHGAILDLWAHGLSDDAIGQALKINPCSVEGVIRMGRRNGDPRAVIRGKGYSGHNANNAKRQSPNYAAMRRRHALAKKFPASTATLAAVIAAAQVQITRLPLGAHIGWRPSWFKSI